VRQEKGLWRASIFLPKNNGGAFYSDEIISKMKIIID
jgi:hypothetical protein